MNLVKCESRSMSKPSLTEARTRFSRRLKSLRVPKGYRTARSFARALDIDENRYTRYERGEVEPSLDLLLRICDLLGATPNDLLCDYIGSAQSAHIPGFADERPEPELAPSRQDHGRASGVSSESGHDLTGSTDATAWMLASELANLRVGKLEGGVAPFRRLELTSAIFTELKRGPFGIIAGLATELRDQDASVETQKRIYDLVDDLVREMRQSAHETA